MILVAHITHMLTSNEHFIDCTQNGRKLLSSIKGSGTFYKCTPLYQNVEVQTTFRCINMNWLPWEAEIAVATLPCQVGSSFNNCYSKHTRKHRKRSISFKLLCLPRNLLVALVLFNRMLQPPFRRGSTVAVTCLTIETASCVGLLKSLTFGNMFTL